ncbi:MAG: tetratricopeptide repeat protein [Nitrospirae bacterium]|nr:tetratricopeptide repeat protein [Nitrospirota bacterium]
MRLVAMVLVILLLSVSLCWAQKTPMEKAYSHYFRGDMDEAVRIMKEEVEKNPDPQTYYFIGYAYYKMKKLDLAKEYFDKAYRMKSFYAPETIEKK